MFGLSKTKISTEEATAIYLALLGKSIKEEWIDDISNVNCLYANRVLGDDQYEAQLEFCLAIVALELNVVMNLMPKKYDLILEALFKHLSDIEDIGEYAIETIMEEYIPAIKKSEEVGLPPFDEMLYILADKLELEHDPLIGVVMIGILVNKLGNWKLIINKYKII